MNDKLFEDLETEIRTSMDNLVDLSHGTADYDKAIEELDKLMTLYRKHKPKGRVESILSNAPLLGLIGDVAKITMILQFEKADVLVSRAAQFVKSKS